MPSTDNPMKRTGYYWIRINLTGTYRIAKFYDDSVYFFSNLKGLTLAEFDKAVEEGRYTVECPIPEPQTNKGVVIMDKRKVG